MPLPVVASLSCRAQVGLEAPLVHVEVTVTSGLPAFHLVGLPATVVRESRDRVQAALLCSGFEYPAGRIVVNLAPAEIPKEGGRFELPIALGILIASGQLRPARSATRRPVSFMASWDWEERSNPCAASCSPRRTPAGTDMKSSFPSPMRMKLSLPPRHPSGPRLI